MSSMWDWIGKLGDLARTKQAYVLATVTNVSGSAPCNVGAKVVVTATEFWGTVGGGHLEQLALEEARKRLGSGESGAARYPLGAKTGQCCGGVVDLFFEATVQGATLYVFGVGHVGQSLCQVLDGTPFRVMAIDERREWIDAAALPLCVERCDEPWDVFVDRAAWGEATYAVVMTHRHDTDQEIIGALIRKQARYIGLIGSDVKWRRFSDRLRARGVSDEMLARVRCPVGLPTGGKAPREVAISIAAELLATYYASR